MTLPAGSFINMAEALSAILEAENAALHMADFAAAAALLPTKRAALHAIEALPPDGPKAGLADALHRLDHLSAENRMLLSRSIGIQSQVLGIIAQATRLASALGYQSSGKSMFGSSVFALSAKA